MFRFMDGSPQVAGLVNGVGIREQEPFSPRLLAAVQTALAFPSSRAGAAQDRGRSRPARRARWSASRRSSRHPPATIPSPPPTAKPGFRLGQQRLETWPENIGLIAGGHDDRETHRRSSFPRRFLGRHRIDFTTIRDGQQHSNALYGTFVFPDTYVIDRSGQIRRKFINAQDWTSPEILDYLSRL
jgi:hypothetical protein